MIGLPKSTEYNKRIPKQKFIEKLTVTPAIRKAFTEQIKSVCWRNKLAPSTLNIAPGERVTEVEVFEVRLNTPELSEDVTRLIDREIPYHILFLLEYEGKYRAVIGYKEAAGSGKAAFKVDRYYRTDWLREDELPTRLEGLNMDAVYESFVRQIAGESLTDGSGPSLKESVERQKEREQITKRIAALESKMRKEKQLNRQMELSAEIKKLKAGLNDGKAEV